MGWGHLRDAHHLAVRLKKNPYSWNDLKQVLPLLEKEKYFSTLTYGYARGNETVDFVNKVFNYYNLLNTTFRVQSEIAQFKYPN
jgi:membrane-bound lytic murein transglycosylase F